MFKNLQTKSKYSYRNYKKILQVGKYFPQVWVGLGWAGLGGVGLDWAGLYYTQSSTGLPPPPPSVINIGLSPGNAEM